jgi:hypothetical protein
MKLIRCVVLLFAVAFLFPGLALAIDYGVPDTVRIATVDWEINSEADSISPPIAIYGFSDYHTSWPVPDYANDSVLNATSLAFWVRVDTDSWDTDRWGLETESISYSGYTYDRSWSSVDSFISVDEFVFDPAITTGIPGDITSIDDGGARYNGFQIGQVVIYPPSACLPDSVPTKMGDIYLKMSFPRDSIMPDAFDIIIDSAFMPPAGSFKFTEKWMASGFAPKFVQGVVHVTSQNPLDADGSEPRGQVPTSYELSQNYPNPFNPATTIKFSLETRGLVDLSVYNILGRKVKTLVSTEMDAGPHDVLWDGTDNSGDMAASGIYFYKLEAGDFVKTKKMLMLK